MATRKKPDGQRLVVKDDMTIYNAAQQKEALMAALNAQPALELDLSAVGEIDTAGFQLLVLVKREAVRLGKSACIVAHSDCVQDVVDFFGMAAEFGDPILIQSRQG